MKVNSWIGVVMFATCVVGAIVAGVLGQEDLAAGLGVAIVATLTSSAFRRGGGGGGAGAAGSMTALFAFLDVVSLWISVLAIGIAALTGSLSCRPAGATSTSDASLLERAAAP